MAIKEGSVAEALEQLLAAMELAPAWVQIENYSTGTQSSL
jgi:hypothetical protein